MPFTFPDSSTTTEFTGDNGITYVWDVDDSKWQIKGFTGADASNFVKKTGDDLAGTLTWNNAKDEPNEIPYVGVRVCENRKRGNKQILWAESGGSYTDGKLVTDIEPTVEASITNKKYVDEQDAILRNSIAELETNSGVLISSEWTIILSGSSRPGKVMLYTAGLQGGVVAWTDVAFIGFVNPDKNGVTYNFSDIPVGANIRLTGSDNSGSGCTFKIGENSDASIGLFRTASIVAEAGSPANETAYKIDFLPGASVTIEVMKTITAASSDFTDFQTRIAAL